MAEKVPCYFRCSPIFLFFYLFTTRERSVGVVDPSYSCLMLLYTCCAFFFLLSCISVFGFLGVARAEGWWGVACPDIFFSVSTPCFSFYDFL